MRKQKSSRGAQPPQSRPTTVLVIGDDGQGKTALCHSLDRLLKPPSHVWAPEERPLEGRSPEPGTTRYFEYAWSGRAYRLIDPGSQQDLVEGLISGTFDPDACLVVISAASGPTPVTEEQLRLARKLGVAQVIFWLSQCDRAAEEWLPLVHAEARRLLERLELPADTPLLEGIAGREARKNPVSHLSLRRLLAEMNERFLPRPATEALPLRAWITALRARDPDDWELTVRVERGTLVAGQTLELIGAAGTVRVMIDQIRERDASGWAPELVTRIRPEVSGTCRPAPRDLLVEPGTSATGRRFEALYYPQATDGADQFRNPEGTELNGLLYLEGGLISGLLKVTAPTAPRLPAGVFNARVSLSHGVSLEAGMHFSFSQEGESHGFGVVVAIVE